MAKVVRKELVTQYSIDATKALRNLGAMRKSSSATAKATNQLSASVNALGTNLKTLTKLSAIYVAFNRLSNLTRAVSEVQTMDTVLRGATGSVEDFDRSLEFLSSTADRLGLSMESLERAYAPFVASAKGAGLTLEQTEKAFEGTAVAAAAFRLSAADLEGAMLGLQQLVNSTNVNLEDLRQVVDRIPGGMKAATEAAKRLTGQTELTTGEFKKLVSDGLLPASEFVPVLAEELRNMNMEAAAENADTYGASLARLDNALLDVKRAIVESGLLDALSDLVQEITYGIEVVQLMTVESRNLSDALILASDIEQTTTGLHDYRVEIELTKERMREISEEIDAVNNGWTSYFTTESEAAAATASLNEELAKTQASLEGQENAYALAEGAMFDARIATNQLGESTAINNELTLKAIENTEKSTKAIGDHTRVSKAAEKQTKKLAIAQEDAASAIANYLLGLQEEIELAKLSDDERARREISLLHEKNAREALEKATEHLIKGETELAAIQKELASDWEASEKLAQEYGATLRELEKDTSDLTDVFGELTDDLGDVFSDLFSGGIESAEEFVDELKDVLISGISDIIGDLAKQTFKVAISAVINTTTGAITSTGGAAGDSGGFSLGSLSKLFSGNGLGEGISKGLTAGFDKLGIEIGDTLGKGLENIASTSSLALAGGSILGGLAGSLLFEGTTASIGSSIGSTAGSIIGASIVGGPIGAIAGGLLGGVGGGFLGSLFGEDDRVPYAQFRVEGGGIRGAGGWGLDEDDMAEAEAYIQSLHDVLTAAGELLGPEAQIARFEFNRAASAEMDPAYIEDFLLGTSREILQTMVDAVPGQLGQLYGAVLNAAGSEFEDVVAAIDEISGYITLFAVAVDSIKPGAFQEMEEIAGAINQIALADIPAVTQGLVTLAELMESLKSPAEKTADSMARVTEVFDEAGLAVPRTVEELRALVAALDLTTADGLYASQAISTVAEELQLILKSSETAADGLDALGNSLRDVTDFVDSLQSATDRNSEALAEMQQLFAVWGLQLPSTEQALYDLIQAGAFTDEQLQLLASNSEKLGYAFAALDQILADEIDALREASDARIDIMRSESEEAIALIRAQQQARIDGLNAEKDAINDRISEIRDSISGLQSIIDSARKAIFDLSGQAAFGVDENRQRLLELAREGIAAGELPDNVGSIISGLGTVNANDFATREEYLAAVEENQRVLDELAKIGEGQLSEGERQISLLEAQLDGIDAQIDSINDQTDKLIAAEKTALDKLIAAEESEMDRLIEELRNGLQPLVDVMELVHVAISNGPGLDEYTPVGETPTTPNNPDPWAPTSFSTPLQSTSTTTQGQNANALLASIAATNREMAKLLKRWNGEGLPADRDDYLLTISENTAPTGNATP